MTEIRSPRLLALGVAMLAAAGALGTLLHHDGEVGVASLATADAGDAVRLKGTLAPWSAPAARTAGWAPVQAVLLNATYEVVPADDGTLVLATFDARLPADRVPSQVVEGPIAWAGAHPADPARRVVVLREPSLTDPIVFR